MYRGLRPRRLRPKSELESVAWRRRAVSEQLVDDCHQKRSMLIDDRTLQRAKNARQNLAGSGILFVLFLFPLLLTSTSLATTRHYYIAAEDVTWNYAPSGYNLLNGNVIPQPW